MKTACFIPIKEPSERIVGKNFRILCGRKLYEYILEHVIEANCFDNIFVDTNSLEIKSYALGKGLSVIDRLDTLAKDTANGNDLLIHLRNLYHDFDYYFQLFATAPFLQGKTIATCAEKLFSSVDYDSCFTAIEQHSFYWFNSQPINYRPGILPRSQDMTAVIEETTGMYGIKAASLDRYQCRIGKNPYVQIISKFEAVDINTEDDLKIAELIGKAYWNFNEGWYNSIVKYFSCIYPLEMEVA